MSFVGPMSDICDISDNSHDLLDPPSPAYTNVTVRRAFIVWMYCGQRNKFKDVCNYFHYLEAWEDQLTPERRALSRHHEFNLFSNQPPTSTYLIEHFPHLYQESYIENKYISKVEEIRNEKCVFKLEGFNEIAPKKGATTQEIVEASRMIRKYCRIQMISLKKFLENFKLYASKCDLKYTVNNVAFYIKRKMLQSEIELEANYTKKIRFISSSVENVYNNGESSTIMSSSTVNDGKSDSKKINNDNNFKSIKILQKDTADAIKITKNYWSDTDTSVDNTLMTQSFLIKKGLNKNDGTILPNDEITILQNQKTTAIADLTDDHVPLKKERRFSGSRFMKIELEKFRKI